MRRTLFLIGLSWMMGHWTWASPPAWTPPAWTLKDTQRLDGQHLRVVCSGAGPDIGFARQSALDSCKVSAAQELATEITIQSMSITSERQVAFQQEVRHDSHVSGLFCVPRHEELQQSESEVRLWLLCEFDLSKARVLPDREPAVDRPAPMAGAFVEDRRQRLSIAVVPGCTDLIVRGRDPARVVPCLRDPVSVLLGANDREIILRAPGYFPKTIRLNPERRAGEDAQVVLQPAL